MQFILDGMFALSLLLALAWGLSVRRSLAADRARVQEAARKAEREAEEAHRRDEREARLNRAGEPLRCLGCDTTFLGPLGPEGCPRCGLTSLVVPEAEAREAESKEKGH